MNNPVIEALPDGISIRYQVCDKDGQPAGRETYLKAESAQQLIHKLAQTHAGAVLALERYKRKYEHLLVLHTKGIS